MPHNAGAHLPGTAERSVAVSRSVCSDLFGHLLSQFLQIDPDSVEVRLKHHSFFETGDLPFLPAFGIPSSRILVTISPNSIGELTKYFGRK